MRSEPSMACYCS